MFASFVSPFTNARCSDTLPFHHVERGGVHTTYGCRVEMSTFGPETSGSCFHPAHAQSVVGFIFKLAKNLLQQYFHKNGNGESISGVVGVDTDTYTQRKRKRKKLNFSVGNVAAE